MIEIIRFISVFIPLALLAHKKFFILKTRKPLRAAVYKATISLLLSTEAWPSLLHGRLPNVPSVNVFYLSSTVKTG